MTTAIETDDKQTEPLTEADMLAWRRSLRVGDDVALCDVDQDGNATYTLVDVLAHNGGGDFPGDLFTNETQVVTSWEAFSRETGFYVDGDSNTRLVYPSADIREQIDLSTQLQEGWNFRSESLARLRAIAWILDIKHGPAPGFDVDDYDIAERADTLEALLSAVDVSDVRVQGLEGNHRFLRQAAASVVKKDGGKTLYALSLGSFADIPIGNSPGDEEAAHLLMYALRCLPEYVAILRDIERNETYHIPKD